MAKTPNAVAAIQFIEVSYNIRTSAAVECIDWVNKIYIQNKIYLGGKKYTMCTWIYITKLNRYSEDMSRLYILTMSEPTWSDQM